MRTIEQFADALIAQYGPVLDPKAAEIIAIDYAAGEYAVAAISVIEIAPRVSKADLDELEVLSTAFDEPDRRAARSVIVTQRKRLAA